MIVIVLKARLLVIGLTYGLCLKLPLRLLHAKKMLDVFLGFLRRIQNLKKTLFSDKLYYIKRVHC